MQSSLVEPAKGKYFGYTGVGNVLDYTVVTVPAGKVDRSVDGDKESGRCMNRLVIWIDRFGKAVSEAVAPPLTATVVPSRFAGNARKLILWEDDANVFHGAPIGLQIMGKRLEEEKVLAIAGEVGRCLST